MVLSVSKGFNVPWKQDYLENVVRQLFPDEKIVINARKVGKVASPATNSYLELDLWISGCKLALEYQDPYHYKSHWKPLEYVQYRDSSKQQTVEDRGDTLVIVPCWWDGKANSLAATIREKRPDLLQEYANSTASAIPTAPPTNYFEEAVIPEVGALTTPLNLEFHPNLSTNNWWLTEKYGGIRFCWNGKQRKIYNKIGHEITNFFHNSILLLPRSTFEGEIWFGRDDSPHIAAHSLSLHLQEEWRLIVLDNPDSLSDPIEQRILQIYEDISIDHPIAIIAWQMKCRTDKQMREVTQNIYASAGLGVALRAPNSMYMPDRSPCFVEFSEYPIAEALVVDVSPDCVSLRLDNGEEFTTKKQENSDVIPNIGDIVKFTCTKRRNLLGLPLDARILEIVSGKQSEVIKVFPEQKESKSDRKPFGYWQSGFDGEGEHNARVFLDEFARKRGLDPRVPESWYQVNAKDIHDEGGKTLILRFQSISRLVSKVYPDIQFDPSKFRARYWAVPANRRQFFVDYAKSNGFDPLLPHNWYSLTSKDVFAVKGGKSVLYWYGFSLRKALMELFPKIGIDLLQFDRAHLNQWSIKEHRRAFFEKFAKKHNFDPLVTRNWYKVAYLDITAEKGGPAIMKSGSLAEVIGEAFGFELDTAEFRYLPKNHWAKEENRRDFFVKLAMDSGLDHLNPDHWYYFPPQKVLISKHGLSVLNHHGLSFPRAVMELFPNIGLNADDFKTLPKGFWGELENRKAFFERFAKSHKFDPLVASEWYKFSSKDIKQTKEGTQVFYSCRASFPDALESCFPNIGIQKSMFGKVAKDVD